MDQDATRPETSQPQATQPAAPEAVAASAPASAASPAKRGANGSRILNIVLGIALVLAVGAAGFAGGRLTAPASTLANGLLPGGGRVFNGTGATNGQGRQGGGLFSGGGPTIEGTVESVTDTTMTIKTADGQTIQIALNGSTTYHSQTDATSSDVATGGKVQVRLDVGSFGGGPNASPGTGSGATARDVTVVP